MIPPGHPTNVPNETTELNRRPRIPKHLKR